MEHNHFSWVNPLFLWAMASIANCNKLPEGIFHSVDEKISLNPIKNPHEIPFDMVNTLENTGFIYTPQCSPTPDPRTAC
jgi:hypothetical protein